MKKYIFIIFIILLSSSAILKFKMLSIYDKAPLSGDAPAFLYRALHMHNFYACSDREPLWILWTKFWSSLTEKPETGIRTGNIILSLFSTVLIYLVVSNILGSICGLAGSFFFMVIPYMLLSPIRAHRLEMYLFLLLTFTYSILFLKPNLSNAVFTGIFASALVMVRMESLLVVFIGIIWYLIKTKNNLNVILICAVLFTLTGPFFYNCWKEKGSPLYVLNVHSRFYTRHEKAVIKKELSEEQVLEGKDNVPETNIISFLFKSRSLMEITKRFVLGYTTAVFGAAKHLMSTPVNLRFFIYPVWAGLILLLFNKKGRILLFWGLVYILPHSFILSTRVAGHTSVDIRFAASATPLISFGFAGLIWGIPFTFNKLSAYITRKRSRIPEKKI